jgi:hypothetical protein
LLICIVAPSDPETVKMIRHEAVDGARDAKTKRCVGQDFTKLQMEGFVKPSGLSVFNGHLPVNTGRSAVGVGRKTAQVSMLLLSLLSLHGVNMEEIGTFSKFRYRESA